MRLKGIKMTAAPFKSVSRGSTIAQPWSFATLVLRIAWGVFHSKRLPPFGTRYKVSYVVISGEHPGAIANTPKPPQAGERVQLGKNTFVVLEVKQLMPPRGRFCYLQASCRPLSEDG